MWRDLVWKDINRYCKIATEIYGDIQRDMERDTKIVRDMETHSYSEELELRRAPHWSARAELRAALRAALRAKLRAAHCMRRYWGIIKNDQ